MTPLLRAEGLCVRRRAQSVLASASIALEPGTTTALVGRNGTGKTTLLRALAGWIAADQGWVEFRGRRYHAARPARMARDGMLLLPVDRSLLSPAFSLAQHLDALERRFAARPERGEVTERLGLAQRARVPCRALSGGERRWAEVAVALLRRPACLLADEPLRGLDPLQAEKVITLLRELASRGAAVLLTGHEAGTLLPAADRVLWLEAGTTRTLGSPAEARDDWQFRRDYLALDRVRARP